jgi:ABC-type branched-subunit amino acid transport system ATPase component
MPDDVILETRKLTKEFHGFVAVNGVDLRKGEECGCLLQRTL